MKRALLPLVCLAALASSTDAAGKPRGLRAMRLLDSVEIDGVPSEWEGDWRATSFKLHGQATSDSDLSARVLLAYDKDQLYLAADVRDDVLVPGGDFVELLLGIPGGTLHSIRLFPGSPGKARASARTAAGRVIDGARVVEAPAAGGFTLEASLPWATLPKHENIRVGYRAAIVVHDADTSLREESQLATTDQLGYSSLPPLSTEPELSLGAGVLREHNLTGAPRYNLMADLVGDKLYERVLVYDRYLVVLGPGYRDGQQYFYRDLGTSTISRFELDDFTGDGKADILLRKQLAGTERVEVLSYHGGTEVTAELLSETLTARDQLRIAGRGKTAALTIESESSSRSFAFREGRFVATDNKGRSASAASTPSPMAAPSISAAPSLSAAPRPVVKVVTRSAMPTTDPDAVYALYRRRRNVEGKPAFDLSGDFSEDGQNERLVVHGSDLVVFGPGFQSGRSFAATTLPVAPNDIESVTARELTGDGKSDVVVRAKLRAPLPPELGHGEMIRTVVMVFQVRDGRLERVFAAEIGRRVGDKSIEANVRLDRGVIELTKAHARGYDEKSYPWQQRTAPEAGVEPLLLPWGGIERVRLKFDQKSFVRS